MKLALVTDAWHPQVNGVVTTLDELVSALQLWGIQVQVFHPGLFRHRACPGYDGIDLAIRPYRQLRQMLLASEPDAVHLATEGPLGWAGRRVCADQGWAFTTAFHTKFPEILHSALGVPLSWSYALFRHFHQPAAGVMVPSSGVLEMLRGRGFQNLLAWTHGVDTGLFRYAQIPQEYAAWKHLPRPYALFVGRISYEKNIEAFLSLDLPGSKIVCGVGPLEARLRNRYPEVHWMGVLPREELALAYAAADVFVFPSRSETFGLVMLESMASGTPVAAYPVDGPLQVLGMQTGPMQAGVLHEDLALAVRLALQVPRAQARARAMAFGWQEAARQFAAHLVAARGGQPLSRHCHTPATESDGYTNTTF